MRDLASGGELWYWGGKPQHHVFSEKKTSPDQTKNSKKKNTVSSVWRRHKEALGAEGGWPAVPCPLGGLAGWWSPSCPVMNSASFCVNPQSCASFFNF